jgi:Ca2+-binding EF-hand superfamily protein
MVSSVSGSSFAGYQGYSTISATQRHKEMFARLDADSDGKITATELQSGRPAGGRGPDVQQILERADTNGDGSIDSTKNESFLSKMDAQRPQGPPPGGPPPGGGGAKESDSSTSSTTIFDKLDTNKDGKVSLAELMAAKPDGASEADTANLMKEIDTNGDGSIDRSENEAFMTKMKELRALLEQNTRAYNSQGQLQASAVGSLVNASA